MTIGEDLVDHGIRRGSGACEELLIDRATVALAFVQALPSRPVAVAGTQRPDRLVAAVAAGRVHLDRSDVFTLIQASTGVPLP